MIVLRLDQVDDIDQLHDYLAEQLHFPEYYGKNLNALHDCIGDVALAGVDVRLAGTGPFLERFRKYGEKVLEIFAMWGVGLEEE